MKNILRLIFGLGFFINKILSTYSNIFNSTFFEKKYTITVNDSLIFQEILIDKFFCLQKCSIDFNCLYAHYESNICSLYSEEALNNLVSSNDKIIYQKNNYDLQSLVLMRPIIQSDSNVSCINNTYFWSSNKSSCVPCKPNFFKQSELPFSCYHSQTGLKNFTESKSYCQSKGGFLFRPKTKNERYVYIQKFPSEIIFVDSTITSVGQKFKWPDGSNVVGFGMREPNNQGSTTDLREGCLELRSTGFFNDGSCSNHFNLTICQHD
ncbi:unnamed protein product [Brachionus calyciflorus]|uniref:C-type lectin domain-containing protein n=1 Tax=Brachionus calyciflorus TaxID=104777 RepID=A0A814LRF6_9BILA|nr:unnamed protein product [Brachionus calyciflorus]